MLFSFRACMPGICAAVLLAGCAPTTPSSDQTVDMDRLPVLQLDAPIMPLTGPVQITTTAVAPFREICTNNIMEVSGRRPAPFRSGCSTFTITPAGRSGGVSITKDLGLGNSVRYTRSATGAIGTMHVSGPAFERISEADHTTLMHDVRIQSSRDLPRQSVTQNSVLRSMERPEIPGLSVITDECRVIGRSVLRGRDVIVTNCESRVDTASTNSIMRSTSQGACDIQTGMMIEGISSGTFTHKPSQILIARTQMHTSIR